MLLLLAIAVAFFAFLRSGVLAARVRELEAERDELRATVTAQRTQLERGPASQAAESTESRSRIAVIERPAPQPLIVEEPGPAAHVDTAAPASTPAKPSAETPSADWESYLGIKGAGWVGGIAFLLSAVFFVRWTIDQGLIGAGAGFSLMLAAGIAALAVAELAMRKGIEKAMNPVSAAGVALLYMAFFAAQSRYALIPVAAAFAGLVAVTVVGGLLSVRYRASAPAVLSLAGGFGAAFALLTGEERPAIVFAYTLLLNAGVLAVVMKGRWFALLWPSLTLTLLLQIRWFWSFMSPENMPTGVGVALVLGLFHLVLPMAAGDTENRKILRISGIGGLAPFLFAFFLATSAKYVDQWPLLFGMIAALDVAILLVAVLFGRGRLLRGASVATSLTLAWWALQGLKADRGASLLGSTLFAIAIVAIFGLARRVATRLGRVEEVGLRVFEGAALVAGGGLFLFGLVMVGYERGAPVGPFLALATALGVLLIEISSRPGRLVGAVALCSAGLVVLTQVWFFSAVNANTLIYYLAGPIVVSLLLVLLARRKARTAIDIEAEIAVQVSGWVSILGLFLALVESDRTSSGWPLFVALASTGWPLLLALVVQVYVVIGSVLRSDWTIELPVLLAASAMHIHLWQRAYLTADQRGMALAFTASLYLTFVLLPLRIPFERWKDALPPWLASAMAGPFFFFPLETLFKAAFGSSLVGLLPLMLAGVAALTLREVSARFVTGEDGDGGALRRVRYLTLFSLVAFFLLGTAIRIQFDRQWVTVGWALEGLALIWLFGRLAHPSLAVFAGILYALVAARLLFNPAVLGYAEPGLPILNWILYTYGIAIVCCWFGQSLLRRTPSNRWISYLAGAISLIGLLLGFWFVNLEILDFFSKGSRIALDEESGYAVKLAFSVGWGVYAVGLLMAGVISKLRPLRYLSLAFLILTVGKVFLYDLAALGGIFKALSFLGLAAGLILVSFFYQRFVFKKSS